MARLLPVRFHTLVVMLGLCICGQASAQGAGSQPEINASASTTEPAPAPLMEPSGLRLSGSATEKVPAATGGLVVESSKSLGLPELGIGGIPLAQLLDSDATFSGLGSFTKLLPKYGISSYVHGIITAGIVGQTLPEPDLLNDHEGEDTPRFIGELTLFVGAELMHRVFVEAQVFFDAVDTTLSSDFAQLDLRVFREFLFVRAGRFLTPMGGINIYPEPQFMFPLTDMPLFYGNVIPSEWGELGLQFYGRYKWGDGRGFSYSFYVVNGLEQRVVNPGDPLTGGPIRDMRNNFLDTHNSHKSVGWQFQMEPSPGLTFGVSGYEGVYTETGEYRIYVADAHMSWKRGKFTLRGEFATTLQETETNTLLKLGGYGLLSYRFKYVEPIVMVDAIRLDGSHELDRIAATFGVAVFPFPQKVPSSSVRASYAPRWNLQTGEIATHHLSLEARVAF